MRQLSIQVHPLSKRVLLCEYGSEPFIFPNHDFYFKLLSSGNNSRSERHAKKLSTSIDIMIDDTLARHVKSNRTSIGTAIMGFHFQTLCRYADAALQLKGRGHVKAAIESWLLLHGIDETEYSAETAYKLWQRNSWNLEKKNPYFFGQTRGKSALILSKKTPDNAKSLELINPLSQTLSEMQVELAVSNFVSLLSSCFRHPPQKIKHHARIYYYMEFSGLSCRDISARLGVPKSTASYARQAIQRRARQNPTFNKMLQEALPYALPTAD